MDILFSNLRASPTLRDVLRGSTLCVATVLVVYLIHSVLMSAIVRALGPDFATVRPFELLPVHIFTGWDCEWYRRLSQSYDRFTWPPLYPGVLRLLGHMLPNPRSFEKSALIINFLCHVVVVAGLCAYLREETASPTRVPACTVALLALFFPGHNVFFAAYSESLYLAVTVWVFALRRRDHLLAAGLLAGIASLTRTMGSFLCAALLLEQVWLCLRARRLRVSCVLSAGTGLMIFGFWNLFIHLRKSDLAYEQTAWLLELIQVHVPPGESPRWWAFKYLVLSTHKECLYFWITILVAVHSWRHERPLETFYIAVFNFSILLHTYRPFPWSRFVSVLFPWAIMAAELTQTRPRLQFAVFAVSVAVSLHFQVLLFSGLLGEP